MKRFKDKFRSVDYWLILRFKKFVLNLVSLEF